jgi:endonuclease YncB( thermonuclease family)
MTSSSTRRATEVTLRLLAPEIVLEVRCFNGTSWVYIALVLDVCFGGGSLAVLIVVSGWLRHLRAIKSAFRNERPRFQNCRILAKGRSISIWNYVSFAPSDHNQNSMTS